jgi:DNA processing protein
MWARLSRDAAALDAEAVLARHEAAGQRVVAFGEAGYPERLIEDQAPPAVLFLAGSDAALARPTVAIVGTRNATRLGRDTAASLASQLVALGVSVVSGLALGIDGAAHQALVGGGARGEGAPIGVIATGLERAYPRRHQVLQQQVASAGLLVSESPIGSEPARWRFPARNRIIAGLSDAVVVVESRSAGGSMLTAAEALARDRTVLAVPGHPTAPASAGTLDLIADGAVPVRDVTDVMVAIGCGGRTPSEPAPDPVPVPEVSETAARLLDELGADPRTLGELMLTGPWSLDDASLALVELEQAGLVTRSGAWFERSGPLAGLTGTRRGR